MTGHKTLINISISVVVIVIAFFAYRFFFPGQTPDNSTGGLIATTALTPGAGGAGGSDEFLQILLSLKSLDFKTEVFDSIRKSELKDFTTVLSPQIPGRPNPFAPIGSDARTGSPKVVATSTKKL